MKLIIILFMFFAINLAVAPRRLHKNTDTGNKKPIAQRDSDVLKIPMIYVAGGSFKMGFYLGNLKRNGYDDNNDKDEFPVHQVKLSSYNIGKWEVTQAEWFAVMGNSPSYHSKCDNCPVENVSWDDAQIFIIKLNSLTGKKYRLPTEAEWEFAARGGIKSKGYIYSGISDNTDYVGWTQSNSGTIDFPFNLTRPVAKLKANELGIYDMTGNVSEWCQDIYDPNYYAISPIENPRGPVSKLKDLSKTPRVCRGVAYVLFRPEEEDHITKRFAFYPNSKSKLIGFRLALDAD